MQIVLSWVIQMNLNVNASGLDAETINFIFDLPLYI